MRVVYVDEFGNKVAIRTASGLTDVEGVGDAVSLLGVRKRVQYREFYAEALSDSGVPRVSLSTAVVGVSPWEGKHENS